MIRNVKQSFCVIIWTLPKLKLNLLSRAGVQLMWYMREKWRLHTPTHRHTHTPIDRRLPTELCLWIICLIQNSLSFWFQLNKPLHLSRRKWLRFLSRWNSEIVHSMWKMTNLKLKQGIQNPVQSIFKHYHSNGGQFWKFPSKLLGKLATWFTCVHICVCLNALSRLLIKNDLLQLFHLIFAVDSLKEFFDYCSGVFTADF